MGIIKEFREFLKEYKVLPLAIAFIIGAAATALILSIVNNLIMPLINPIVPKGGWQNATIMFGPESKQVVIGWGALLGAIINFIIIAFVVFLLAKMLVREKKEDKEKKEEKEERKEKK